MPPRTWWIVALAVVVTSGAAGCAGSRSDATVPRVADTRVHNGSSSYDLPVDAETAMTQPSNRAAVYAVVVDIGEPFVPLLPPDVLEEQRVAPQDPMLDEVSTPVTVRVLTTVFGEPEPGEALTLRMFGGETTEVVTDGRDLPLLGTLRVGDRLAFFTSGPTSYANSDPMYTPNQMWQGPEDDLQPTSPNPDSKATSLAELQELAATHHPAP